MKKQVSAAIMAAFLAGPVWADGNLEAVPTAWRLQDYTGGQMIAYYTGSECSSGSLVMAGTADENNRFWSTVMSAKIASKIVGVFYNPSNCAVTSFYLKEQ